MLFSNVLVYNLIETIKEADIGKLSFAAQLASEFWRRGAETKRIHGDEEYNEYHHLLIMESLGGDQRWSDRFWAQHSAVAYYWVLIGLWLFSPSVAYNFSELIEAHAVDTYEEFTDAERESADAWLRRIGAFEAFRSLKPRFRLHRDCALPLAQESFSTTNW